MLTEIDLSNNGFLKSLMPGTGWNTTASMRDAVYYYQKGRISVNATTHWSWFLDKELRNDLACYSIEQLQELTDKYK